MDITEEEKKIICDALLLFEYDMLKIAEDFKEDDLMKKLIMDRACEINHVHRKIEGLVEE